MSSSNRSGRTTAAKFDKMMERLGIDPGYILAPRLGLAFSCALRTCRSCTACEECAEWLARDPEAVFSPPKFCPNADLLWEFLCDRAIGRRAHLVP